MGEKAICRATKQNPRVCELGTKGCDVQHDLIFRKMISIEASLKTAKYLRDQQTLISEILKSFSISAISERYDVNNYEVLKIAKWSKRDK